MHRYATIIIDDDGREVVSAIALFEGTAPTRAGRIEPVMPGVLIGMVRGGPVDAVGGFGFPRGAHGVDGRAIGLARANLKAAPGEKRDAPTDAAGRKAARKPPKAKRRKPVKGKRARPKPVATAAEPAGTSDHG